MIEKIKRKYQQHYSLIKNFSYLSILQIFNLLLPLITFPYLIRILGKETYGLVIYAQAIIAYFNIFINFGFNISATKDVSINRDNPTVISTIVSSVLLIKVILLLTSFILLSLLILLIPTLRINAILYLLTLGVCIYETLFPIWYFQGIEQMKYITYINVVSRGTFTALIFLLIRNQADYLLVPALNTIGAVIAGAISMYLLFFKNKIKFKSPSREVLWKFTKESAPFFFSRATGVMIARSNTVLIGSLIGYTEVAYYDLAVKISELIKIPSNLINQTVFPRISVSKNMNMVKQIIRYNFILSIVLYLAVLILINPIIYILGGTEMLPAKYVILLLSLTAPLAGISYFLGNTMLVVNGFYKEFNQSVIYEALVYVGLAVIIIVSNTFNLYTFACIIIICGLFELSYRYYYIKKYKII